MRRMLLTGGGVEVVIPDPLPGDGGGDPDPVTGWPTTADATILAMRPTGRTVASGTVANAAAFDTESTRQVNAITADTLGGGYGYWDFSGPDYRTAIFMQPGSTYAGGGAYDWRALVGTNPASRSLMEKRDNSGGVIHSFGSIYLENLHLRPLTTDANSAPKYPWHITGGKMCIAAKCSFDLSGVDADTIVGGEGIAGWIGADGESGMTIVLYKCGFIPGPLANTLNIHGSSAEQTHPITLILVDCTGLDAVELYGPGDDTTDGERNAMYVINTPCAGVGGGPNTDVFTNGSAPQMTGDGAAATIHRGVSAWPIPEGGLSELWRDHFYPSSVGAGYKYTPPVTDAAPFQPVVGRTYYTRVRPDRGARYTHHGVTGTTAAGQVVVRAVPADTPYERDEAPAVETLTPDSALVVGSNEWKAYYSYSRYPGDNGFWVKCAFSSAAARVTGSAQLAGITDCAYTDDGTTLVPVAAGTPHPLPFVRAT